MPVTDGLEACRHIKASHPHIGIIACSMYIDKEAVDEALQAGADAYVSKNADKEELLAAITQVANGGNFYCKEVTPAVQSLVKAQSATIRLTQQDKAILQLLCRERTSKEIAAELFLSVKTIETYRKVLLRKCGVVSTAGLVAFCFRNGIVKP
jgi:DNA-binding NarL/FixJ family response regulator